MVGGGRLRSCWDDEISHAMNMRAGEAIVSSAPKPMNILPIREVWSQVVLSLLLAITGAAGGGGAAGASAEEGIAGARAGWRAACHARSTPFRVSAVTPRIRAAGWGMATLS